MRGFLRRPAADSRHDRGRGGDGGGAVGGGEEPPPAFGPVLDRLLRWGITVFRGFPGGRGIAGAEPGDEGRVPPRTGLRRGGGPPGPLGRGPCPPRPPRAG